MSNILVVGSAVVDFVFEVDTLPDRPEKYRANGARVVGGGCAANAAVAIARLGGSAHLAGRVGDDATGRLILADLQAEGVNTALTNIAAGGTSSFSSVYVDQSGERQIMNFRGDQLQQDPDWDLPKLEAILADTRWPQGAVRAMQTARTQNIPGVLDAEAPIIQDALALASHVAFSRQGLDDYLPDGTTEDRVQQIAAQLGCWVCVTDGADGVTWNSGTASGHVASFKVDVVDTLGAGDIWHGAFTLALAEGVDEVGAIRFANAAAALKCTQRGGRDGTPRRDEINRFLQERSHELDAR